MNVSPWIAELWRREKLPREYLATVQDTIAPLAECIAEFRQATARPVVVGLSGAQGCGKSTLSLFLESYLRVEAGIGAAILSLDDLYLDLDSRRELARTRHPLLRTRGVPGTHEVTLGVNLLEQLTRGDGIVLVPVFDKAADDRRPRSHWTPASAPVDVVLFEGWCVGAHSQDVDALELPINELERVEDADGSWRHYVNERLAGDYARLFGALDALVFLQVPSFEMALEWRTLQERKLQGPLDDVGMKRFVQHFERLSRHMLETVPGYADVVIEIDAAHRITGLQWTGRSFARG